MEQVSLYNDVSVIGFVLRLDDHLSRVISAFLHRVGVGMDNPEIHSHYEAVIL